MKDVDKKLNQILDIDILPKKNEIVVPKNDVEDDYEYTRGNLRDLIDQGKETLHNLTYLANEGESPRAYEVVGQMIKTLTDTNKELLDLAKKAKELNGESNPTNVTNALFVGSTAELQKLLKEK